MSGKRSVRLILAIILLLAVSPARAVTDEACLRYSVFKEAGSESIRGMAAVRDVVMNRMRKTGQSCWRTVSTRGQFSWDKRKISTNLPTEWLTRYEASRRMLPVLPESVLWFHNNSIRKPKWAREKKLWGRIGRHYFYE